MCYSLHCQKARLCCPGGQQAGFQHWCVILEGCAWGCDAVLHLLNRYEMHALVSKKSAQL
jgi:hypothetical protein